jgi:hypothetical protein
MNTIKKVLMLSAIAGFFAGCSSDDGNNGPNGDNTPNGIITSLGDPDYNAADLKGRLGADITLPSGEYTLTGKLAVPSGYTLTIEPGAVFKAATGGELATSIYILVEQGGKLNAVGTAEHPIKFTSGAAVPAPGDWGGILLCGRAPLVDASGNQSGYTALTEVGDAIYGGSDAHDNSGHMEYVEIAYSGARINTSKEFNNFTCYAVGDATVLKNLYIHDGSDDNVEFFGGTVNVSNMMLVNSEDDTLDWCLGWTGSVTNCYESREAGFTNITNGSGFMEGDGYFADLGSTPANTDHLSRPTFSNFTIVNKLPAGTNASTGDGTVYPLRAAITLRTGCGLTLTNAKVIWTNAAEPANGLLKITDATGAALPDKINIDMNYTGPEFASGPGFTITDGSPFPGSNVGTFATADFLGFQTQDAAVTGADTSVFAWTGYSFQ